MQACIVNVQLKTSLKFSKLQKMVFSVSSADVTERNMKQKLCVPRSHILHVVVSIIMIACRPYEVKLDGAAAIVVR